MNERDLQKLTDRLKNAYVTLPHCEQLAKLARHPAAPDVDERIRTLGLASKYRRSHLKSMWWPCDAILEIVPTLREPCPRSVRRICDFFKDIAALEVLFTKKPIPLSLKEKPPFLVKALAVLERRRVKNSYYSCKQLSEVELWFAAMLFGYAMLAQKEISKEFERLSIANTCPHCGLLYVDTNRKYCSDQCGAAARSAKHYSSNRERLMARKREESRSNREFFKRRKKQPHRP